MSCCVEVYSGACPSYNDMLFLPKCDAVATGALCDGDGECGTDNSLNNCQTWDVYTRVVCTPPPLPFLPPPPSPSPPPPPPRTGCPGNMVWNDCGSSCNSTCTEPLPVCAQVCIERCECPLDKPVWHDHLGACATTTDCLSPVTSAASGGYYVDNPCNAYSHVQNQTSGAAGWYHTGRAQMTMFQSSAQDCCNACSNLNSAKPPPPPNGPPPPGRPPETSFYNIGQPVPFDGSNCHAIAVYSTSFGVSCRFYHRRLDGTMGVLLARDTAETQAMYGSSDWYTVPFPPPPPQDPPPPSPPAPGGPPAAASTVAVMTECPKFAPTGETSCVNYTIVGSCSYNWHCCPGGGTCLNLTHAVCSEAVWSVAISAVNCPDSSPFSPPPPPLPPPPPKSNLGAGWVAVIVVLGVVAIGGAAVGGYFALVGSGGGSAAKPGTSGAAKPLLATSADVGCTRASDPPWTFQSLHVR